MFVFSCVFLNVLPSLYFRSLRDIRNEGESYSYFGKNGTVTSKGVFTLTVAKNNSYLKRCMFAYETVFTER